MTQTTALWTADDVAAHLQVRREWVLKQSQRGLMPAIKIGRFWRYDPDEIQEVWQASRAQGLLTMLTYGPPQEPHPEVVVSAT
jgi:hypothetical protein